MKEKKAGLIFFRIITMLLMLSCMGLIFYLSSQNANESSNVSGGFIKAAIKLLFPGISADKQVTMIESLQFIVRKSAHFSLYTALGFLSYLSFVSYSRIPLMLRATISALVGIGYAVSDEYHQTFIPGRSGELRDVCIDSGGVLLAVFISLLVSVIWRHTLKRKVFRMRKKQYIELTDTLQKNLHESKLAGDKLREENFALNKKIALLEADNEKLKAEFVSLKAEKTAEETDKSAEKEDIKPTSAPEMPDDMSYGAGIIGRIVYNSTKHCNSLTATPANPQAKELINLILGRTEVAKSEILRIVSSDTDSEAKRTAMQNELFEAEDYFKSVMAQK